MTAILRCQGFEVKIPSKLFANCYDINNYFRCLATCPKSLLLLAVFYGEAVLRQARYTR
jgi:hypothetical protein